MKNHGYELEHNFGRGQKFLAMMLAALNLLAFARHTVLESLEPPWQATREAAAKRTSFFAHILALTTYVVFPSSKPSPIPPSRQSSSKSEMGRERAAVRYFWNCCSHTTLPSGRSEASDLAYKALD